MKKIFSFLTAILFVGSMWGTDQVAYTLTPTTGGSNGYATLSEDLEIDGISWNVMGNTTLTPWRIGGKGSSQARPVYSTDPIIGNITKVEVEHGAANNITINSVVLYVSTQANGGGTAYTITPDKAFAANSTMTFTRPTDQDWTDMYYKFVYTISVSGNNNKYLEFKSATFYEEENTNPSVTVDPTSWAFGNIGTTDVASKVFSVSGANLTAGDLTLTAPTGFSVEPTTITLAEDGALAATNITVSKNTTEAGTYEGNLTISGCGLTSAVNIALSMTLVAPVAVTDLTLDKDAISLEIGQTQTLVATILPEEATNKAVTWESNDEDVATVDENGKVTAVAAGDATITCKSVANNAIYAECAVNVHEHVVTPGKYDITLSNTFWGVTSGQQAATVTKMSGSTNDISLETTKGSSQMYANSTQTRFYGNGTNDATLTISVPSGYSITAISFTEPETDKSWGGSISVNEGTYTASSKSWANGTTGSQSVTFTFGAQNRVASVSVTFIKSTQTAVDNTEAGVKAVKKIVNGQLLIEKNGRVYNAFGQTVK